MKFISLKLKSYPPYQIMYQCLRGEYVDILGYLEFLFQLKTHSVRNILLSRKDHCYQHHHIITITPVLQERSTHQHNQPINSIIQNIGISIICWIDRSSDQSTRIDRSSNQSIRRIIRNLFISAIHWYDSINISY